VRQSALFSLLCTALICGCKKRGEKEAKKRGLERMERMERIYNYIYII
jgi:hypothetical protein